MPNIRDGTDRMISSMWRPTEIDIRVCHRVQKCLFRLDNHFHLIEKPKPALLSSLDSAANVGPVVQNISISPLLTNAIGKAHHLGNDLLPFLCLCLTTEFYYVGLCRVSWTRQFYFCHAGFLNNPMNLSQVYIRNVSKIIQSSMMHLLLSSKVLPHTEAMRVQMLPH